MKGFLVNRVYKELQEGHVTGKVKAFLSTQPPHVVDMIKKEAKAFRNMDLDPLFDIVECVFVNTPNGKIAYSRPVKQGKGTAKNPTFYSCPKCAGRLFRGNPNCLFCGADASAIDALGESAVAGNVYLDLVEYLYTPETASLSHALEVFAGNEFSNITVTDSEIEKELDTIQSLIPG